MARACPRCGSDMPEKFSFCGRCGARLEGDEPSAPPMDERRQVTCVFADISGFTSLAERLDPEELQAVMRTAWDAIAEEIRASGGLIEKYIGDAVVAVFGAPVAHEDDPERALATTLAMQDALDRVSATIEERAQQRLGLRIGVNTGVAMAGAIGDRESEYGVLGDAVNVAARLQQAAKTGEILVGEATYRLAAARFQFEPHPIVLAKGKSAPLVTWRLVGEARGTAPAPRPPLVGRDDLVAHLLELLAAAERGSGHAVTLVGEQGMGLSRLVDELLFHTRSRAVRVARVSCTRYERLRPFGGAAEILRSLLGIAPSDPLERARRAIADLLPGLEPEVRSVVLETAGYGGLARPLAPSTRRRLIERGVREVLRRVAQTQTVLLVIEDAQDVDGASLQALSSVVRTLDTSRAMLLVTRPPGVAVPWRRHARHVEVPVGPLAPADAARLLRALRPQAGDEEVASLVAAAGGSPSLLVASSRPTEALTAHDRRVLQAASVLGRSFDASLLRAVVSADVDADAAVERLLAAGIVEPASAGTLRFREGTFCDAMYHATLPRVRGELHGRAALAIERHRPDAARNRPELLARHFALSTYTLRAIEYALRAAEHASLVDDLDAAAEHLRSAADLAERLPEGRRERARALRRLAEVERRRGDMITAIATYERVLELVDDAEEASDIHLRVGRLLAQFADLERAAEHLARAQRALPEGDPRHAELAVAKAWLACRGDRPAEALAFAQEAVRFARDTDDARADLDALTALEMVCRQLGRLDHARSALERAAALAETLGDLVRSADLVLRLATSLSEAARFDEAERRAHEALARFVQLDDDAGRARALRSLAEAQLARGGVAHAEETLFAALAHAQRADEDGAEPPRILHLLGETALVGGDAVRAEGHLRAALDGASERARGHVRARSLGALARIALQAGDLDAARRRLGEAEAAVEAGCARCAAQLAAIGAEVALARGDAHAARERCAAGMERAIRAQLAPELALLRRIADRISAPAR